MADDTRAGESTAGIDTLSPELREIESRLLQDSLVWGADLDGIARLTQLVQSLPGRKSTDTVVSVMPIDGEHDADSVDSIEATPLDNHHPIKQRPGEQKAPSPWIAGVAALVIVALLAVVFSTLVPGRHSGTTAAPTATAEATATTQEETATPSPTPTATTTTPPAPVLGPFTATLVIQPNGNNISASAPTTSCASQVQFWFNVIVQYSYAPAGYMTFRWQHYDGNAPGEPSTLSAVQAPSSTSPQQIPTGTPPTGDKYQYSEQWTVAPADYSGSTARWGDQFIITSINGKTLATPIASNILHVPTGC